MSMIDVLNGNQAAAKGAALSRPDVVAAYPITPQTPLVEYLTQFVANGELEAFMSEVESEHSAMSVVTGASLAGSRTFTATSSQGLALMYEPYFRASTLRLPVVMAIVNREMISPQTVWGGPQDSMTLRDAGWIQIYVEDNQEILDMIIQAYKIGEDSRVLLPVNICYDGFYLSHLTERVEIPEQDLVDKFLPDYAPTHIKLDPRKPMAVDPLTTGDLLMEYREKHMQAQQNALKVIQEVNDDFADTFGRNHFGLLEKYRCDDADVILISLGSMTGAAREAVDYHRDKGLAVGLLKIRSLRPFPHQEVSEVLSGRQAIGVVDRNVSFGWNTGILYQEIRSALYEKEKPVPILPFIGGLGGEDLRIEAFIYCIEKLKEARGKEQKNFPKTCWLNKKGVK